MSGHPGIVVEHRKELSYLLCQAAEIEHLAMCQYLYAAFSLRSRPGDGLTVDQLEHVERWRSELLRIAGEEMLHWGLVNNLLTAVGSAPFVSRPDLPHRAKGYPPTVQFALLPFGERALRHFIFFERPEDSDVLDAEDFEPVVTDAPMPMDEAELLPRGQDFATQGDLYRSLEAGLDRLAAKLGEEGLFIGPPWAQATPEAFHWPDLVPVTDLATAQSVLRKIVEQGEGARGDAAGAHFGRFRAVLDDYRAVAAEDPAFRPTHPVVAAGVRSYDAAPLTGPRITDPTTAAVSDLANVVYDLILQILCRYFAFGHESQEQSALLADTAVALMSGATRPLGMVLAELPVTGDAADGTAGADFRLAYRANFLLPHRRVAWIRFAERLEEAADFADGITAAGETRRVLDGVAAVMRKALVRLSAHIEAT